MDISDITRDFIAFWQKKKSEDHGMPTRANFPLYTLPAVLPHMLFLDIYEKDSLYYATILFAGSKKCELNKSEMNGINLLFLFDKSMKSAIYSALKICKERPTGFTLECLTPYERGISTIDQVTALPVFDEKLNRPVIAMLSYATINSSYDPISMENPKAKLLVEPVWLDIGAGIPDGATALSL